MVAVGLLQLHSYNCFVTVVQVWWYSCVGIGAFFSVLLLWRYYGGNFTVALLGLQL